MLLPALVFCARSFTNGVVDSEDGIMAELLDREVEAADGGMLGVSYS